MENKKPKRNMLLLAAILIFVLLMGFSGYRWLSKNYSPINLSTANPMPTVSQNAADTDGQTKAPNFTVLDTDGNQIMLYDYLGAPIILNFWASWCGPCQNEMPEFQSVYQTWHEEVVFMMINLTDGSRETQRSAVNFINEKGYTFPVYYDTESQAANAYGITSIPTTFFINAQGHVVAVARGTVDKDTLLEGIGMITGQD